MNTEDAFQDMIDSMNADIDEARKTLEAATPDDVADAVRRGDFDGARRLVNVIDSTTSLIETRTKMIDALRAQH